MTQGGGTIFSLNNDGTDFTVLYNFDAPKYNGLMPWGDLVMAGGRLFGMTGSGGIPSETMAGEQGKKQDGKSVCGAGVIFSLNTDGSGYTMIHGFAGPPVDGTYPR